MKMIKLLQSNNNNNTNDANDVSPPQLLQLNENDRLHLGTDSLFDGTAYRIQFCVNLLSVD